MSPVNGPHQWREICCSALVSINDSRAMAIRMKAWYRIARMVRSSRLHHILRLYWPPAWKRVSLIWPSEQYFTVSINSSKMFPPDCATW